MGFYDEIKNKDQKQITGTGNNKSTEGKTVTQQLNDNEQRVGLYNNVQQGQHVNMEAGDAEQTVGQQAQQDQQNVATPHLNDTEAPVVLFVGPAASGKSMILVRLSQYLRNQGYSVETDPSFLNTQAYRDACADFNTKLSTTEALKGTTKFLLVSVKKNGSKICQFLEAPGEDYFNPNNPDRQMPAYIANLVAAPNKKIFIFLLDLDSEVSLRNDADKRHLYANRLISNIYHPLVDKRRDRVVLLYNKIDVPGFGDVHGVVNSTAAEKEARMLYTQVFNSLNRPILGGFFHVDNFVFKTFCTGIYTPEIDQFGHPHVEYDPASDKYPADLWKEIMRRF